MSISPCFRTLFSSLFVSAHFFSFFSSCSPLSELPKQLLACVDTLGVLCRASPSLLAPHVETLLPYLKGENGLTDADESAVCRQVGAVSDFVFRGLRSTMLVYTCICTGFMCVFVLFVRSHLLRGIDFRTIGGATAHPYRCLRVKRNVVILGRSYRTAYFTIYRYSLSLIGTTVRYS